MNALAHAADFQLGRLQVSPSTREVTSGGWRALLEPRVMQVLVALHNGHGRVLSRDDLLESCWDGRIVGSDALDRVIGKLRRLSQSDGGASFTVETIARVGYRLRSQTQARLEPRHDNIVAGAALMLAMLLQASHEGGAR